MSDIHEAQDKPPAPEQPGRKTVDLAELLGLSVSALVSQFADKIVGEGENALEIEAFLYRQLAEYFQQDIAMRWAPLKDGGRVNPVVLLNRAVDDMLIHFANAMTNDGDSVSEAKARLSQTLAKNCEDKAELATGFAKRVKP
jgi:hypothetical protein